VCCCFWFVLVCVVVPRLLLPNMATPCLLLQVIAPSCGFSLVASPPGYSPLVASLRDYSPLVAPLYGSLLVLLLQVFAPLLAILHLMLPHMAVSHIVAPSPYSLLFVYCSPRGYSLGLLFHIPGPCLLFPPVVALPLLLSFFFKVSLTPHCCYSPSWLLPPYLLLLLVCVSPNGTPFPPFFFLGNIWPTTSKQKLTSKVIFFEFFFIFYLITFKRNSLVFQIFVQYDTNYLFIDFLGKRKKTREWAIFFLRIWRFRQNIC